MFETPTSQGRLAEVESRLARGRAYIVENPHHTRARMKVSALRTELRNLLLMQLAWAAARGDAEEHYRLGMKLHGVLGSREWEDSDLLGQFGEMQARALLSSHGWVIDAVAPKEYHPAWDFIAEGWRMEVKTDWASPYSGNLFIPVREKGKLSGVFHPQLEADWWWQYRPHARTFYSAPVTQLQGVVAGLMERHPARIKPNGKNNSGEEGFLFREDAWLTLLGTEAKVLKQVS